MKRLEEIKKTAIASHDELPTGSTYLDDEDIFWLIEQAQQLERIKKLSNVEDLTVGEFANGVLLIIDNKEKLMQKERS